jgi:hypothetical protein
LTVYFGLDIPERNAKLSRFAAKMQPLPTPKGQEGDMFFMSSVKIESVTNQV